jgi:hypothetical protein
MTEFAFSLPVVVGRASTGNGYACKADRQEPQRVAHLLQQVSDATSCPAAAEMRCGKQYAADRMISITRIHSYLGSGHISVQ